MPSKDAINNALEKFVDDFIKDASDLNNKDNYLKRPTKRKCWQCGTRYRAVLQSLTEQITKGGCFCSEPCKRAYDYELRQLMSKYEQR